MISRLGLVRLAGCAVSLTVLAACQSSAPATSGGPGASRQGVVDAERAAFCRRRAEEIFLAQNRADIHRPDNRDAPFSGPAGAPGVTRGLSDRFAMDRMISDCIRNTGERSDPIQTQPASPAAGPLAPSSGMPPSAKAPPPPPPIR